MTLIGLLSDYPLPELLFDLGTRDRSGWLTLRSDAHEIELTLFKGSVVAAASADIQFRLGQRFLASGHITDDQLAVILTRQRDEHQVTTGQLLVDSGYVTADDVQHALSAQIGELLSRILTHPSGYFSFQRGIVEPRRIPIDVSLEHAVLSAISRADEWVSQHLHSGRIEIADDVTPDMIEPALMDGWPVIEALLDGAGTFDEIVGLTELPRDDARAAITALHGTGVVHILAS